MYRNITGTAYGCCCRGCGPECRAEKPEAKPGRIAGSVQRSFFMLLIRPDGRSYSSYDFFIYTEWDAQDKQKLNRSCLHGDSIQLKV